MTFRTSSTGISSSSSPDSPDCITYTTGLLEGHRLQGSRFGFWKAVCPVLDDTSPGNLQEESLFLELWLPAALEMLLQVLSSSDETDTF